MIKNYDESSKKKVDCKEPVTQSESLFAIEHEQTIRCF